MKKKYQTPIVNAIEFKGESILAASSPSDVSVYDTDALDGIEVLSRQQSIAAEMENINRTILNLQ